MKLSNRILAAWVLVVLACVVCLGCGGGTERSPMRVVDGLAPEQVEEKAANFAPAGAIKEVDGKPKPKDIFQNRKIIYNAELRLSVADLDESRTKLQSLVTKNGGFIAGSEIRGTVKQQRSGYWKIRIPVTSFESFRNEILQLGEVEQNSLQSQDITKEYTDIQSRLKNAKQTEERLKEHLKRNTKKLEDILKVEQEIDRVRQRIEEMEGQIRMWDNLTSLSTIMVYLTERGDYVPAQTASFGTQLGRTFSGSVGAIVNVGKGLLFAIVALAPWLPIIAVIVVPVWLVLRRVWRAVG